MPTRGGVPSGRVARGSAAGAALLDSEHASGAEKTEGGKALRARSFRWLLGGRRGSSCQREKGTETEHEPIHPTPSPRRKKRWNKTSFWNLSQGGGGEVDRIKGHNNSTRPPEVSV